MQKLIVFNHVSLDGYFTDAKGDMSFAQNPIPDGEWDAYVAGNARGGGTLVFGRITYELMASFWPTSFAAETMPELAHQMNNLPKVMFSRTLKEASWNNTRLVQSDPAGEIRRRKQEQGAGMVIFGSGNLISQLAQESLIDEYQIIVDPVALGKGRTMFEGLKEKLTLTLKSSRLFGNGNVLLCYEPAA